MSIKKYTKRSTIVLSLSNTDLISGFGNFLR